MTTKLSLPTVGPCKFCGHKWVPRKPVVPDRCGRCKRFNWSKERK